MDVLSDAMQDTYSSREPEMHMRQLRQMWQALRSRGHTVASFEHLHETGTEHWNVPCDHGMAAHNDNGCVDCECTTPGFQARQAPTTSDQERTAMAYTLLVSSIPALYRSWNQSPNEVSERLNAVLYDKVVEWVAAYQQDTGQPVDVFPLAIKGDGT